MRCGLEEVEGMASDDKDSCEKSHPRKKDFVAGRKIKLNDPATTGVARAWMSISKVAERKDSDSLAGISPGSKQCE
jgi:hypothetical protein